jgi:ribokinase
MCTKVLFAGDGNVDLQFTGLPSLPQTDREILCDGFDVALGGSTTICAAAYSLLGGRATFCGLLGDDDNGRRIERVLRQAGVSLDLLRFTRQRATGVTVNLVYGSTRTQVTYPGTLSIVDETDRIVRDIGRYSHLHLAGLFLLSAFLPRVTDVLTAARRAGVTTSISAQWDPRQQWQHLSDWLPLLDYLFVNEQEAMSITGCRSLEDAFQALSRRTGCPLVTLGARGALAGDRSTPSVPVAVRDTTGAGDSFAAGFLFAVKDKQLPFGEAVRYACAAGALSCTYVGGVSPELSDERVLRLMA